MCDSDTQKHWQRDSSEESLQWSSPSHMYEIKSPSCTWKISHHLLSPGTSYPQSSQLFIPAPHISISISTLIPWRTHWSWLSHNQKPGGQKVLEFFKNCSQLLQGKTMRLYQFTRRRIYYGNFGLLKGKQEHFASIHV